MRHIAHLLLVAAAVFCGAAAAGDAPFLWEVKGAKATHYLMGSVHLLPESAYPLPASLDNAYGKAEALVFESDLAALSDPKTQMQLLSAAQAPGGIKALAGDELYARLQQYLQARALPAAICDSLKPWFCALTLELLGFEQSTYRPDLGLDQHYFTRARSVQKTILWLEEPAAHLKLFSGMTDATANQLLSATLSDQGGDGATPQQLVQAWQAGDVAALEKIAADFKSGQPQLYERLLAARNRAWLPRLEKMFGEESSHLVIVGAAHLVGPDGLVGQLKARGYAVTAVASAPAPESPAPAPASIPLPASPAP